MYQFVVGQEHAHLNEGPWLKYDFYTVADTGTDPGVGFNTTNQSASTGGIPVEGNRKTSVDWLYGEPDGTRPISTSVSAWNTINTDDGDEIRWDASGWVYNEGWTNH